MWKGSAPLLVTTTNDCNRFKNKSLRFNSHAQHDHGGYPSLGFRNHKPSQGAWDCSEAKLEGPVSSGVSVKSVQSPVGTGTEAPVSRGPARLPHTQRTQLPEPPSVISQPNWEKGIWNLVAKYIYVWGGG